MLLETNLRLLDERLAALQATPFFRNNLQKYVDDLRNVTQRTLSDLQNISSDVAESIARRVWKATQFLSGSNVNLIPYEVVYCLELALRDWTNSQFLITTAITQDRNFYFVGLADDFYQIAENFTGVRFEHRIVQIQLPELYRQRPLYNLVLYHELGHFIDTLYNVSGFAQINMEVDGHSLPDLSSRPPKWSDRDFEDAQEKHTKEYFADLFAACYLGSAMRDFLGEFAPDAPMQISHPATYNRRQIIDALLAQQENAVIEMFNLALKGLGLERLEPHYSAPKLRSCFDMVRPYSIRNVRELHGMFESGWSYLVDATERRRKPWSNLDPSEVERTVNDLTEKSIRNFMITERWQRAAPN